MKSNFKENKYGVIVIIITTLFLGVIFVKANFIRKCESKLDLDKEDSRRNITADTTIGSENTAENILRIVSRAEWLAEPATEPLDKLVLPVHRVVIAHTATGNCTSQATCTYRTRVFQNFHMMSLQLIDIGYNFLVGGDGCVYEGRGWDQRGTHTGGFNMESIGIAFIGTFVTITPPEKQLNAAKLLIEEGIRLNKLVKDYRLYGTRQLVGSKSPGSALNEIIKKWPNWSGNL